jgi:hypothetical protein
MPMIVRAKFYRLHSRNIEADMAFGITGDSILSIVKMTMTTNGRRFDGEWWVALLATSTIRPAPEVSGAEPNGESEAISELIKRVSALEDGVIKRVSALEESVSRHERAIKQASEIAATHFQIGG